MGWKILNHAKDIGSQIGAATGIASGVGTLTNKTRDAWDNHSTSDLIKTCEKELRDMSAKDIPVQAGVKTQTGEFIQKALGLRGAAVDGDVGAGTIKALNARIEQEFAPAASGKFNFASLKSYTGAVSGAFSDKFEDLKGREYKSAGDIDGRTVEFLTVKCRETEAFGDPKTKQDFAEAMNEIGTKTGNGELQMAAHKLEPQVVPEPKVIPEAPSVQSEPAPEMR